MVTKTGSNNLILTNNKYDTMELGQTYRQIKQALFLAENSGKGKQATHENVKTEVQ